MERNIVAFDLVIFIYLLETHFASYYNIYISSIGNSDSLFKQHYITR